MVVKVRILRWDRGGRSIGTCARESNRPNGMTWFSQLTVRLMLFQSRSGSVFGGSTRLKRISRRSACGLSGGGRSSGIDECAAEEGSHTQRAGSGGRDPHRADRLRAERQDGADQPRRRVRAEHVALVIEAQLQRRR